MLKSGFFIHKPYNLLTMIRNIIASLLLSILWTANMSCSDKDSDITSVFEIESTQLTKSLDNNATQITIPVNTTLNTNDWNVVSSVNWLFVSKKQDANGASIIISAKANTGEKRETVIKVTSSVRNYSISITQYGPNDVIVESDYLVQPYGGKDSEHQPGQDITNTYDGKFAADGAAPFHTPWGQSAHFPVTLEYYFRGDTEIDYLIYYTRSGNGNFGKLRVYTTTTPDRSGYTLQGEYDFKEQNAPSRVSFSQGVKATGVKFEVLSGLGNFVSCDEMQFFKKNTDKTLDKQLLTVFTDVTCTALKTGVDEEAINALPAYFVRIAEALKNNSYDEWEKEFRIHEYEAYSNVEEWAAKLMTKKYSNLDNPTGISVNAGDEVIVLVGDTHGQDISLQCIWETGTDYVQTAASGDVYMLQPGVNKLMMKGQGQLFVMYNTDITSSSAKPIKIHIPLGSGKVNGYFDLKKHRTDTKYSELLHKATHKYFCVRGEKIMFYFHRTKMLEYLPNNILSAINLWDNIIGWQQELMGIEDVRPSQVNNHMFAISPEGSYMWASDYQIAFVYTYLGNILLYDNVMAAEDNAWGPAHEIGHVHQEAINWPSSTESSNNLFSNYIIYRLGKYKSRGQGINYLAQTVYGDKKAWWNMGTSTHQNEDTEMHMRMNWQLWTYYERCKGNENKPVFWPQVFKIMRDKYGDIPESDPGKRQMAFVKAVCEAAQEDLTDFFETWGFFKEVNTQIEQYGTYNYLVTAQMIEDTKSEISKYDKKAVPIQYIEDRIASDFPATDYRAREVGDVGYYIQFKNNIQITKPVSAAISGKTVSIANGDEAVAFEIRKGTDGKGALLYFANTFQFTVPQSIVVNGASLFAVQADGVRKLITQF